MFKSLFTMILQHLSHGIRLTWRGGGVDQYFPSFRNFDLEMRLSHIPKLNILGHVIKHGTIRETNLSKLKQQSLRFGGKSVRHLE